MNLRSTWAGEEASDLSGLSGATVISSTQNLSVAEELGTRALLLAPGRAGLLFDGPSPGWWPTSGCWWSAA